MKKFLIVALFISCIALIASCGAKQEDYFPLHLDDFWEYEVTFFQEGRRDLTERIIKIVDIQKINNIECFVMEAFDLSPQGYMSLRREFLAKKKGEGDSGGVFCYMRSYYPHKGFEIPYTDPDNPDKKFAIPPVIGSKWKWSGDIVFKFEQKENTSSTTTPATTSPDAQNPEEPEVQVSKVKGDLTYEILGREKITIMNQVMDCIKLKMVILSEGDEIERTHWYANGIGLVKQVDAYPKRLEDISVVMELRNYNIIKDVQK